MTRLLIPGLGLLGCLACTTLSDAGGTGGERMEMTGLEGMSLEFIKEEWGEPDSNIPKGEGRVVHYKKIRSQDEDPVTGAVTVKSCDVRLDVSKDVVVETWDYENCQVLGK